MVFHFPQGTKQVAIRILDKMMIKAFLPPFLVATGIALFVLTMQFLWVYVDEIMGKGVDLWTLLEFVFYLSVSLVPMAMSIGVLLASVMTMGNLAERYELTAMKTAGISLGRIMQPLIILSIGLAGLSFIFSNYLIPVANLKFKSRLYDIRTQKPALSLEEGVFNYDFKGYVIRIGKKHKDKIRLEDITIVSQGNPSSSYEILAEKGKMYTTKDKKFFVMQLENGWQYQEPDKYQNPKKKYPLVRVKFDKWQKVFDLSEFQMEATDESLFKTHQSMLNVKQLLIAIDSLEKKKNQKIDNLASVSEAILKVPVPKKDSLTAAAQVLLNKRRGVFKMQDQLKIIPQLAVSPDSIRWLIESFPANKRKTLINRARNSLGRLKSSAEVAIASRNNIDRKLRLFRFEMLSKFNIALACIIFLFIGAPMGAIIKKGGFGYPLLVAIVFFIVFIMMTLVGKKMNSEAKINVWLAAFLSSLVLLPIGLYLTRQAMREARLFEI